MVENQNERGGRHSIVTASTLEIHFERTAVRSRRRTIAARETLLF